MDVKKPVTHFPFVWHEGMEFYQTEKNKLLITDIKMALSTSVIKEEYKRVIEALMQYEYLQAFMLQQILATNKDKCNHNYVSKLLGEMVLKGYIRRFQFQYEVEGIKRYTPFIYELRNKFKNLLKGINKSDTTLHTVDYVLRKLAFNQFYIMTKLKLGDTVKMRYHMGEYSDGTIILESGKKQMKFKFLTMRMGRDWKNTYLERLGGIYEKKQMYPKGMSGVIVLVENENQALEAEKARISKGTLNELEVYYLTDIAALSDGYPLEYLIYVKADNNYSSYETVQLPVDGYKKEIG